MGRAIDLTGRRFGWLRVVALADKRTAGKRAICKCQCDCGIEIEVSSAHLKNGLVKSCGCYRTAIAMTRNTDFSPDDILTGTVRLQMAVSKMKKILKQKGYSRRVRDLTGQRFGRLTVIEKTNKRHNGQVVWKCRCDCGKIVFVDSGQLTKGRKKSCGCLYDESIKKRTNKLTGHRFGKLIAIRPTDERRHGEVVWECRCDCGKVAFVASGNLVRGNTKSCGCLSRKSLQTKIA